MPSPVSEPRAVRVASRPLDAYRINFSWLVKLRWGAITGQLVVIAVVQQALGIRLPLGPLAVIIGIEAASNLACAAWLTRQPDVRELHVGTVVAVDVVLFTALLYFTGGPTNAFSFLYLVHIALAALVLRPRWMWALVALTLLCSGALFLDHVPLEIHAHHGHAEMHYQGMWVALGVAASFIVYFLYRATRELAERELELERVREQTARHERLASLATLAAGAAHELATPLSTIAVASKELERMLAQSNEDAVLADVRLIRKQVARCREILGQLATDAGQASADTVTAFEAQDLVERALAGLPQRAQVRVRVAESAHVEPIVGPARALVEAMRNLVKNALEASGDTGAVDLVVDRSPAGWSISVSDSGAGMSADVSARAVEPFFTTKAAGSGMGLGLFLCKSVADQLGGSLDLRSVPGHGTEAVLRFPPPRREPERAT